MPYSAYHRYLGSKDSSCDFLIIERGKIFRRAASPAYDQSIYPDTVFAEAVCRSDVFADAVYCSYSLNGSREYKDICKVIFSRYDLADILNRSSGRRGNDSYPVRKFRNRLFIFSIKESFLLKLFLYAPELSSKIAFPESFHVSYAE